MAQRRRPAQALRAVLNRAYAVAAGVAASLSAALTPVPDPTSRRPQDGRARLGRAPGPGWAPDAAAAAARAAGPGRAGGAGPRRHREEQLPPHGQHLLAERQQPVRRGKRAHRSEGGLGARARGHLAPAAAHLAPGPSWAVRGLRDVGRGVLGLCPGACRASVGFGGRFRRGAGAQGLGEPFPARRTSPWTLPLGRRGQGLS